ncbi:unnamed protein product, partial [Polarella glacialis]
GIMGGDGDREEAAAAVSQSPGERLRFRERFCEQELLMRESEVRTTRIEALEYQCQRLAEEQAAVLEVRAQRDAAGARLLAELTAKSLGAASRAKCCMSEARADLAESQLQARASEREEALLEAVARERVQTSMIHANNACALQTRAEALQAAAVRETEAGKSFAAELQALEARAALEDRRFMHEQKVRNLQLQVIEASDLEAEKASAEEALFAQQRQAEEAAQHAATLRRFRASACRRLAMLEEEEASKWQSRSLQE